MLAKRLRRMSLKSHSPRYARPFRQRAGVWTGLSPLPLLASPLPLGIAVKHSVAKLVKSFGRLGDATESLDDFRYTKTCF